MPSAVQQSAETGADVASRTHHRDRHALVGKRLDLRCERRRGQRVAGREREAVFRSEVGFALSDDARKSAERSNARAGLAGLRASAFELATRRRRVERAVHREKQIDVARHEAIAARRRESNVAYRSRVEERKEACEGGVVGARA